MNGTGGGRKVRELQGACHDHLGGEAADLSAVPVPEPGDAGGEHGDSAGARPARALL